MADEATEKTAEGEAPAPAAPSAPAAEHKTPEPTQHDYSKHFEAVFQEIGRLPEALINALREAIPEKVEKEEEQAVEKDEDDPRDFSSDAGGGGKGAKEHSVLPKGQGRRTFSDKWFGRNNHKHGE